MPTEKQVETQLKKVLDPELKINIIDLGLVYKIKVEGSKVFVLSTLTFPGCPLGSIIHKEIKEKVGALKGIKDVELKITFDPPWDLSKISQEARLELGMA